MAKYMIKVCLFFILLGSSTPAFSQDTDSKAEIKQLLYHQAAAWNKGDIQGYMQGYWKDVKLRFISSSGVLQGWQQTLDRYKKSYPDAKKMGKLTFDIREVRMISDEVALVLGDYLLTRDNDLPHGYFTLVVQKIEGNWRIVQDHTSAATDN